MKFHLALIFLLFIGSVNAQRKCEVAANWTTSQYSYFTISSKNVKKAGIKKITFTKGPDALVNQVEISGISDTFTYNSASNLFINKKHHLKLLITKESIIQFTHLNKTVNVMSM